MKNRQILLRRRPTGLLQPNDTELVRSLAPEPADGEALVRTTYVGIDAAVRTWLMNQPGYLPPVKLGEVIRAAGVGEVVASRCAPYAVGDVSFSPHDRSVVAGVRTELDAVPAAAERPGQTAVALALAAILDDSKHVPTQPAAPRQLVAMLGTLSKQARQRGKLTAVKSMTTSRRCAD
jgi:NADPH-dependent curcumin reductase CurA